MVMADGLRPCVYLSSRLQKAIILTSAFSPLSQPLFPPFFFLLLSAFDFSFFFFCFPFTYVILFNTTVIND